MALESLPNELLKDLFEYLTTTHLLRAFHDLNSRFNILLRDHIRVHGLDFRSVSKHDFDTICRKHLPSIIDRVISCRLSDDDECPQQIDCFLTHGFTLCQFTHLRSLSLHNLYSVGTMNKLILAWCHLSNLTHLKLDDCGFLHDRTSMLNIVNSIWSLPKLVYCSLHLVNNCQIYFPVPKVISSSLERLHLLTMECRLSELTSLFEKTPRLRYLSTYFNHHAHDQDFRSPVSSIITLNITLYPLNKNMPMDILHNLPNLSELIVQTYGETCFDGHQWEQIIRVYLPKLTRFQLKMTMQVARGSNKKQQVDQLLDSFRSRFWLEKHRWFVQCHWNPSYNDIYLYTLPYAFYSFDVRFPLKFKSTCPHDDDRWSYDRVRRLTYMCFSFDDSPLPHIHFSNVQKLTVTLPVSDCFWSIVPQFDQLTSLSVLLHSYSENCQSQLQALLDRATRLYSFSYTYWLSPSQKLSFDNTNISIRRLDFDNYNQHYNEQECIALSRSPLGIQCEVLSIRVKNRTCVLELVNRMTNLRALNVQCLDDKIKEESVATEDELVEWLRRRLPSACTIRRDTGLARHHVHLWIF